MPQDYGRWVETMMMQPPFAEAGMRAVGPVDQRRRDRIRAVMSRLARETSPAKWPPEEGGKRLIFAGLSEPARRQREKLPSRHNLHTDIPQAARVRRKRSRVRGNSLRYPPNGAWPPVMRADMAAAYVDERSIDTFLKKVGSIYAQPFRGKGRNGFWYRASLDAIQGSTDVDDLSELI